MGTKQNITGKDLLEFLQTLTPEELETPVVLEDGKGIAHRLDQSVVKMVTFRQGHQVKGIAFDGPWSYRS